MEVVKKCVREASDILDVTLGVAEPDGRIVASTDLALEDTEDASIRAVMMADDMVVKTAGKLYSKVELVDQVQYIAFIEGTDEPAKTYLALFVRWLMAALSDRNTEAEREIFVKNILLENELMGDIPLKARELKIPYASRRMVLLIRTHLSEGLSSLEIIQNLFPDKKRHFVLAMDEETIVLVAQLDDAFNQMAEQVSKTILDNLNTESMSKASIGIGMPAETLKDISKSYREAMMTLRVGSIFEHDKYVMRYDKLGLGRLIYQLPPTLCQMFLDEVFPEGAYEALDAETLLTIMKFFENNLNGSETSRRLFVHRNTLVYRLDKVQKITGLDLRNFDDAVLFKLASMVRTYLEKQQRASKRLGGRS